MDQRKVGPFKNGTRTPGRGSGTNLSMNLLNVKVMFYGWSGSHPGELPF